MTASLYIHIPFCSSVNLGGLCDYCDFYSVPLDEGQADAFIHAVLGDVNNQLAVFGVSRVPTVYIGGGTPSVLGHQRMEQLLSGLKAVLEPLEPPEEYTVEANPESADEAFLQTCASYGVSRLSLGVQTFHEPSRRAVRRTGGDIVEERLALAAEYFPGAFSIDLITGLPFQTETVVRNDIEHALAFHPGHISLYSLVLEPQTPLGERAAQFGAAALSLPCGDEADSMWISGRDMLEKAGLAQYEVSNFALPEKTCAHNIRYWRMESWLGAGPAASGTIIDDKTGSGKRFTYPADIDAYLKTPEPRIRSARVEELDRASLIRESLLMGFRFREGPDPLSFRRRFGCGIEDCIPRTISRWGYNFFDAKRPGRLVPSPEGLLFLNSFLLDAFSELEHE